MKTFKFFRAPFFIMLFSALALWGCNDTPEPIPEPTPDPKLVDAYEFNDVQTKIQSVITTTINGANYLFLTADKGITNHEDLLTSTKEYIMLAFDKSINTTSVDLMTQSGPFSIMYMKSGQALVQVTNDNRSAITEGKFTTKADVAQKTKTVDFSMTLASGKLFLGNITYKNAEDIPDQTGNEFVINGVSTKMKSFFVDKFYGMMLIVMSPIDGFDSWEGIVENGHPCVMAMLDPTLANKTIDLMTTEGGFQITSSLAGAGFEGITNGGISAITAGTMTFNLNNTNAEMTLNLTLASGPTLTAHGVGTYVEVVPKGILTVNGTAQDILASYYDDREAGSTMLYFTPQQTSGGAQIEDAKCRVQIQLNNTLINGTAFDITTETKAFTLAFFNNFGDTAIGIMNGSLDGATGTISVAQDAALVGKYLVAVDVTFGDGTTLKLTYDSVCDPFYVAPSNEYTLQGLNPKPINSVVIEQSSSIWTIWLARETGLTTPAAIAASSDPIKLTIDATLTDGLPYGFGTGSTMSILYAGTYYGSDNDADKGTLSAKIEGTTGTITFTEWDIMLKGYYNGPITLIK